MYACVVLRVIKDELQQSYTEPSMNSWHFRTLSGSFYHISNVYNVGEIRKVKFTEKIY
jgi:hypothetical protein